MIEDLTLKEASEVVNIFGKGNPKLPFEVGKNYFIRSVTYHYTGKVAKIVGSFLVLEQAAWIADSGRFAQAVASGNFSEVEPYPDSTTVYLNSDSIVDATECAYLPRQQK